MRHFALKPVFATLEPKIQDGRHNLSILKMVQIQKFFFNLAKNLILRNIKMRHVSLKPVFATNYLGDGFLWACPHFSR